MEPDGWVRLHPLSPLLDAGKTVLIGGVFALRLWGESIETGQSLNPGVRLVLAALGVIVLGGLLALGYGAVAWRFRLYRLTPTLVEQRNGVLFRSHRQLPYDRIESVDTRQPLIPRLLGLAEVRVHAISGDDQEVRVRYLVLHEAVLLRDALAARRSTEATDSVAPPAETILVVPTWELMLAYAIIPVARMVALVLGAGFVAGVVSGAAAAIGVVFFGTLGAVLPAGIAAAVRIERLWGFRLAEGPDALVIDRGLLNVNTQRIHTGRVQAIRIDQPVSWRVMGWYRLAVDIAGHRGAGQGAAVAGELLPIAQGSVVRHILERLEVRTDIEALDFLGTPKRARWRSWRARSMAVAHTPTHLLVRSGVLWRKTTIVSHARVQSARVTQGRWQRPLGLASVHLDTAGPRVSVVAHHRDQHEAIAQAEESARIAAGAVTAHL